MATYIKAVLPSGRGIWLEKLTTKQYRAASARVASRIGEDVTPALMADRLGHEMLLAAFRGVTVDILPLVPLKNEKGEDVPNQFDVDAMLSSVNDGEWIKPTWEELVIDGGSRSLEVLLEDPADYLTAQGLASNESLGGGQAAGLRGKVRREYGAQ